MKKVNKRKSDPVPMEAETDIVSILNAMEQRLVVLEQKLDTLISQSSTSQPSQRSFEPRHSERSFQRFDRPHHGGNRQDDNFRERSFTQAVCAECGKQCEVPFKPSGDRPVYCKECFSKRRGSDSFGGGHRENDFPPRRSFNKRGGGENRGTGKKRKPFYEFRKDRD